MHDILVVGLVALTSGAIGLPFSLLLPSDQFAVRWALAPPLGFGLLAAGTAVLYLSGVAPWVTLPAMAIAGLVIAAAMRLPALRRRPEPSFGRRLAMAIAVAAIAMGVSCSRLDRRRALPRFPGQRLRSHAVRGLLGFVSGARPRNPGSPGRRRDELQSNFSDGAEVRRLSRRRVDDP